MVCQRFPKHHNLPVIICHCVRGSRILAHNYTLLVILSQTKCLGNCGNIHFGESYKISWFCPKNLRHHRIPPAPHLKSRSEATFRVFGGSKKVSNMVVDSFLPLCPHESPEVHLKKNLEITYFGQASAVLTIYIYRPLTKTNGLFKQWFSNKWHFHLSAAKTKGRF